MDLFLTVEMQHLRGENLLEEATIYRGFRGSTDDLNRVLNENREQLFENRPDLVGSFTRISHFHWQTYDEPLHDHGCRFQIDIYVEPAPHEIHRF